MRKLIGLHVGSSPIGRANLYMENKEKKDYIPNPKSHLYVSLWKSGLRIFAGVALCTHLFFVAGILIVLAEILGIIEEIV